MSQIFKLLCLAVSVLFLMQIADAAPKKDVPRNPKPPPKSNTYEAPFLTTLKKLKESTPVKKAKEAVKVVKSKLNEFGKDVAHKLNQTSMKHTNDPNNVLPNIVKYHIVDPTVATTKVTYEKFMKNPIEKLTKNIKETYNSRDLGTLAGDVIYYGTKLAITPYKIAKNLKDKGMSLWRKRKSDN